MEAISLWVVAIVSGSPVWVFEEGDLSPLWHHTAWTLCVPSLDQTWLGGGLFEHGHSDSDEASLV